MNSEFTTYEAGTLAYLDTLFDGLVPCKVIEVAYPGNGRVFSSGEITVRITADRGAYKKGELLTEKASQVVPRSHVRRTSGHARINSLYEWN